MVISSAHSLVAPKKAAAPSVWVFFFLMSKTIKYSSLTQTPVSVGWDLSQSILAVQS